MPSKTFTTVGWGYWTVPAKVTSITVRLDGAGSGTRPGGLVTGKLAVKPGQRVYCHVGRAGRANAVSTGGAGGAGGGAAGGNGRGGLNGGWGGGGYSAIRIGSTSGTLKAVAGGAGGNSGDGALGGAGGGVSGQDGSLAGTGDTTGVATGGTQTQGGNGGASPVGTGYNGKSASDATVASAGAGGTPPSGSGHGGGGGGGGLRSGGGGRASTQGQAPGGGGGGGSSFTGGLSGAASVVGGGGAGDGYVSITWVAPAPANQPPAIARDIKLNGVAVASGMLTKAGTSVKVTANLIDTNKTSVRMLVRYSTLSNFSSYKQVLSPWVAYHKNGRVATATLSRLSLNTLYYVRVYTQDSKGLYSVNYSGFSFYTDRAPTTPTDLTVNGLGSGMTLPSTSSATFAWTHNDPDPADYQTGFQLQYRRAATSTSPAGPWTTVTSLTGQNGSPVAPGPPSSSRNFWVFDPNTFNGNYFWEWQVRTRDRAQYQWGSGTDGWSLIYTFRSSSTNSPPVLLSPTQNTALDVNADQTFTWRFVDPNTTDTQQKADIRYRALGLTKQVTGGIAPALGAEDGWIILSGLESPGLPGGQTQWSILAHTFAPGYTYEWSVRTYDQSGGLASGWSDSRRFYAIDTPGAMAPSLPSEVDVTIPGGSLGCGTYRVFIYEQGGQKLLGEVEPASLLRFTRVRDDISTATVWSNGYSSDCGQLYGSLRTWMHEIVVFRDGVRVWEGPITRIAYSQEAVEIEAKDVMAYAYRRIMRQGYNDSYRLIQKAVGSQPEQSLGVLSVVKRASMLLTQGLAPYDPNVLPYLTAIEYPDDAKEARIVADWSRTVWEEVDDLAATAGLDYTTVGRRILLWDTHRPIGRLPEMRDGDFSNSPIVTEYGMQLATFFAVTNGAGVAGWKEVPAKTDPYGPIEQLASSYSDSGAASTEILTPTALQKTQVTLSEQADRNISGRWPAPLIVRVPDNSTLSPKAGVGFQQLIPGVWLPLRSVNTPRQVLQWQKLDSVAVEADSNGEKVNVVLSPAPNGGNDPDADATEAEAI